MLRWSPPLIRIVPYGSLATFSPLLIRTSQSVPILTGRAVRTHLITQNVEKTLEYDELQYYVQPSPEILPPTECTMEEFLLWYVDRRVLCLKYMPVQKLYYERGVWRQPRAVTATSSALCKGQANGLHANLF